MRGFVFTMDAMMALLFAIAIVSAQATIAVGAGGGGAPAVTVESVAVAHIRTGAPLEELINVAGACGSYEVYDANMFEVGKWENCNCAEPTVMAYPYTDGSDAYTVRLKLCGGRV